MHLNFAKKVSFIMGAFLIAGAAHADKDRVEYEGVMKSIPHTSITFNAGSAALSDADRANLRELIVDARANGNIGDVAVVAWSDKALPTKGQNLLDSDRELARSRAEAISAYLKTEMKVGDVDTYNMAETANWFARTLKTEAAEMKSVFGKKGAAAPVTKAEFQVIKNEGGPGEAVVVIERAEK